MVVRHVGVVARRGALGGARLRQIKAYPWVSSSLGWRPKAITTPPATALNTLLEADAEALYILTVCALLVL